MNQTEPLGENGALENYCLRVIEHSPSQLGIMLLWTEGGGKKNTLALPPIRNTAKALDYLLTQLCQ